MLHGNPLSLLFQRAKGKISLEREVCLSVSVLCLQDMFTHSSASASQSLKEEQASSSPMAGDEGNL